jgi:hypothetical protein
LLKTAFSFFEIKTIAAFLENLVLTSLSLVQSDEKRLDTKNIEEMKIYFENEKDLEIFTKKIQNLERQIYMENNYHCITFILCFHIIKRRFFQCQQNNLY